MDIEIERQVFTAVDPGQPGSEKCRRQATFYISNLIKRVICPKRAYCFGLEGGSGERISIPEWKNQLNSAFWD
jgi:hypothetical protein